jgi:hypothetical protein
MNPLEQNQMSMMHRILEEHVDMGIACGGEEWWLERGMSLYLHSMIRYCLFEVARLSDIQDPA